MRTLVSIVVVALLWPAAARAADAVPGSAAPAFDPAFAATGTGATALFAAGGAVRVADGAADGWSAPGTLASAAATARPVLAGNANGAAVAVWRDAGGWHAARRATGGGSWDAMTGVPDLGGAVPRVAVSGGAAVLAYDGPGGVVWSARAAGDAWGAAAAVTGGASAQRLDDVTVSSAGVAYVLYGLRSAVPALRVTDDGGGSGWGTPASLSGATPDLDHDAPGRLAALGNGAVVAAWVDAQRDPDTGTVLARSVRGWIHAAGGDWAGSNFLHDVAAPATTYVHGLALATDGADAAVAAWTVGDVVMAARATAASSWVFEDVVLASGAVSAPVVAAAGGQLAAAWQQDGTQVWGATAPDATGAASWSAAARLDDPAGDGAGPPQAASGAGLVFGWRTLGADAALESVRLAPAAEQEPPPPPPDDDGDGSGGTPVITPPPPPPPVVSTPAPPLGGLAVTCRKRRGKPCRVRVAFAVDSAARATLAFARVKAGKAKRIGSLTASVQAPRARIDVARVAGKALKPGRYRVTVMLPGFRPGRATVRVR